ncbi:kelch repeat-containing protein [Lacrimispora sp. AGF001]|uniref:kelch repeat-containing protein n=1 Tax=Lacrimispora sp. AGF001 TaxID=3401631 RepID=UPI003B438FEF
MSKRALKRLATYICFMLCVLFLGQVTVFADEVNPETDNVKMGWTTLAPMSKSRDCFQTEVIDGKLYAIGGGGGASTAEVYDPTTNSWTTLAPMSDTRYRFQTEVIDGKIYAIGGNNGKGNLSSAEVYNPATNSWTTLANMSEARIDFQTKVIDGKIYAIGGYNDIRALSTAEVYDPTTNKWTTLAPMSEARKVFQTEVIDGKIYAMGGGNGNGSISAEVYDPTTNKWTRLANMSEYRAYFQTEVINGKIYAIGGNKINYCISSAEVYDPTTNSWTTLAPMSAGRGYLQSEVIDGKLYAIGGFLGGKWLKTTEVYDPTTNTWTTSAPMSDDHSYFQSEVIDGKIYAIGGNNSTLEVYAINNNLENQLSATGGNSKVDLTWGAIDKATSYTVKRSTTAGGPYTSVATDLTETSYTDTNVTNGIMYYYVVIATNNGTEIGNSNEASAQPTESQTPPTTEAKLKVVLEVAESLRLSVDDDLNVNTQMAWTSSDPTVATVNEKGIVTALAPGNTVITVKSADGSYTDYINVLVVENADDYRLAIDLRVGETARLTADDFTNTANVTWAPMDSSIANVTTKGKVTALSKGLVLISAKDADGNIIGRVYVRVRE